jgi:hypothetical protein
MMKAIRVAEFGLPEVLQVAETPVPCPGAGQVRPLVCGVTIFLPIITTSWDFMSGLPVGQN